MVLHNPNNWHWVNKDVSEWARNYLKEQLVGLKAEENNVSAKISSVNSMDGDVDVSQRKGKVITIFDVKIVLGFEGKNENGKDGKDAAGTVTIPEAMHDTEEDEYVFEVDVQNPSKDTEPVKALVRNSLVPQLRKALQTLGPALIKEHGKDIQHAPGQGPPTGYVGSTTNKTTSSSAAQSINRSGTSTTSTSSTSGGPAVNTTEVTDVSEFRTTADELYNTFTSVERITAFTRSPPIVWDGPKPGGKFALFGGGVTGEYVSLEAPKKIVQKWRLSQWPAGHYSKLTLEFDQNDVDHVTNMRVTWDAVPVGDVDSTRGKWGEYYVRSLKTTFGFGTIL